jgi:hypothetical protein
MTTPVREALDSYRIVHFRRVDCRGSKAIPDALEDLLAAQSRNTTMLTLEYW